MRSYLELGKYPPAIALSLTLSPADLTALANRAGSQPVPEYVAQILQAVVDSEIVKGERGMRALALAAAGEIEIGRPTP